MAKDETPGLLSKVVKFVRNPMTNWGELDQPELDQESKYSKAMLKEMIERKRRNDFVRRREFDQLRRLRRKEVVIGQDQAGRPSFFQSSMPSKPDDRAGTLKKIDEIEAQMSMQWWKTKHPQGGGAAPVDASPTTLNPPIESGGAAPLTQPPVGAAQAYAATEPAPLSGMPQTLPLRFRTPAQDAPPQESLEAQGLDAAGGPVSRGFENSVTPGYSSSKLLAQDSNFVHDPELEEAAIRFANGDYEGAESGLREALSKDGALSGNEEIWLTLFDLFRATGQQERFESVSIDYAGRFGRSAPPWFSMVDGPAPAAPAPKGALAPHDGTAFDWICPETLNALSLAALNAALARTPDPWRLDWSNVVALDPTAVVPLEKLFSHWCNSPVQLRFVGTEQLEQLLSTSTPSGDRSVDPAWWRLRMEALRILGRADEFELVALDYCVTYEVSPPSWQGVLCQYMPASDVGQDLTEFPLVEDSVIDAPSTYPASSGYSDAQQTQPFNPYQLPDATSRLSGQVLGDAAAAIAVLEADLQGGKHLVVACDRLARVDFSAAGSVLNWVAARQTDGCQVQFTNVQRLVAIFFNVIGINEHARVSTRVD